MPSFPRGAPLSAIAAAAFVLSIQPPAAAAQQTSPASLPTLSFEKYTLPNGLEVILHVDRSVPIVAVNTWYKVGSGDEKHGRTGFAHLFEHVMFMGSEHVATGKFDEWLEAAGVNNNGSTTGDRTKYYEVGPSNALPLMLWLDADRMGWLLPVMDEPKLDLQRDVVKNERRESYDNAPYGKALETLSAALYPEGHPYSWPTIGSMDDLSAASLGDVTDFFRTYYAPNNASLTIAGDFDVDSAKAWVRKYFGPIPRGKEVPVRPKVEPFTLERDTTVVLEDRVQLPRVYLAWHGTRVFGDDDAALDVLAQVVAGGKSSRLYRSLVYEKQIMQDVSMFNWSNRLDGMLIFSATARPGHHPREAVAEFDRVIADIATSGITERELTRVKNGMLASAYDNLATVLGKADQLNMYNYFAGTPDYLKQDLERYQKLTENDIKRVAQDYITGKHRVTLTIVPEGKTNLAVTGAN